MLNQMMRSILINTDSYKVSMWKQYPAHTEHIYSYIEARGGPTDATVWFGLQAFIKEYLNRPITKEEIEFADTFWTAHGEPFNREGWEYILNEHNGYLPLEIRQIPEGTLVPIGHPLATVVNTDPKCWWLTTWVETPLLRAAWYGTNVASLSFHIKRLIKEYLEKSGDVTGLDFKLHDFGSRGANSLESSAIGGAAHLINFMGTDNAVGIMHAAYYYGADHTATAFSIPAAEHSTVTSWGQSREKESYRNQIAQFSKPGSLFAVVSDSYHLYEAAEMWVELKDEIIAGGGMLVIRPDSGDPVEVLPKLLRILMKGFGCYMNDKGYKVLNNVRVIWGDGINMTSIQSILRVVVDVMGFSADNIAFGMGGALLQQHDRDTYKFAMKCSAAQIDGKWVDVFKNPITDPGKTSKKGLVTTYRDKNGKWSVGVLDWPIDAMEPLYFFTEHHDFPLIKSTNFSVLRERAASAL